MHWFLRRNLKAIVSGCSVRLSVCLCLALSVCLQWGVFFNYLTFSMERSEIQALSRFCSSALWQRTWCFMGSVHVLRGFTNTEAFPRWSGHRITFQRTVLVASKPGRSSAGVTANGKVRPHFISVSSAAINLVTSSSVFKSRKSPVTLRLL